MVSTGSVLASQAGAGVLADGGNAFDAAVAVCFVLGVVESYMTGPGGTGVAVYTLAGESRPRAIDFSGRVPKATDRSLLTNENLDLGILAPLVPGNVAGWLALHERHGSLGLGRLLQPAIDYAENGFPITYQNSAVFAEHAGRILPYPDAATLFLDRSGRALAPGTRMRWPQLGTSMRLIADQGRDAFYTGAIAEEIVRTSEEMGGILTAEDLATYEPEFQDCLKIDYRGYQIYAPPLPSGGFQSLAHLKLMEQFAPGELAFSTADTVHALIEAAKLSITDRIAYAGDPDVVDVPLDGLLSGAYAGSQRQRLDMAAAGAVTGETYDSERPDDPLAAGRPLDYDAGHTTHLEVADREGNVISMTITLGHYFGCCVLAGGTGIFLNNMMRMGDLHPDAPGAIAPGRRPVHAMGSTQVFRDGRFILSLGMPGGWAILQRNVQILVNLLDFGLDVQQAIEAPQFRLYVGRDVHIEERLPLQTRRELEARGHEISWLEPWSMRVSGAHAIHLDPESGVYSTGCDVRREGLAIGI